LIDSIIDSGYRCDWLKQLKRFTTVLAETKQFQNSFETVLKLFCFSFISIIKQLSRSITSTIQNRDDRRTQVNAAGDSLPQGLVYKIAKTSFQSDQ